MSLTTEPRCELHMPWNKLQEPKLQQALLYFKKSVSLPAAYSENSWVLAHLAQAEDHASASCLYKNLSKNGSTSSFAAIQM